MSNILITPLRSSTFAKATVDKAELRGAGGRYANFSTNAFF